MSVISISPVFEMLMKDSNLSIAQLKKLDAQSECSSSVSTSPPTLKRKESNRSSTLPSSQVASSSNQPFSGSPKKTNNATSDSPIPASRLRQRTSLKIPRQTKPTSITMPTTSATPRKRSPSVIIIGDSDDEIDSKQTGARSKGSNPADQKAEAFRFRR